MNYLYCNLEPDNVDFGRYLVLVDEFEMFDINNSLQKVSIKADFEKLNDELSQKFQTMADL